MNALLRRAVGAHGTRWLWIPVMCAVVLWTGCRQAQDGTDNGPDDTPSPGWRGVTGTDPSDPFVAPPELVSRYLDDSLQYHSVATYNVDPGDGSADSVSVRFESVRGSHLVGADAFDDDGHVFYRYILESRDRSVPWLGLTPNDTLGYLYVLPGRAAGDRQRYSARFAVRTGDGGWRGLDGTLSVIVMDPPSDAPDGSWVIWGAHQDDAYMQRMNAVSQELFGSVRAMSAQDHCFACISLWCWVITDDS